MSKNTFIDSTSAIIWRSHRRLIEGLGWDMWRERTGCGRPYRLSYSRKLSFRRAMC